MSVVVPPARPPSSPGGDLARTPHRRGTPGYRRLVGALWLSGVSVFALLYAVQALLPAVASEYALTPAAASLALSVTTGGLAVGIVPVTALADRVGRARLMTASLGAAATLGLLAPLAPGFEALVALRALQGLAMAGVPAVAMAHLSDEVHGSAVGHAMGLWIAGNTVGGLSGRLVASAVADVAGWRAGLAAVAGLAVVCAVGFRWLLPPATARPARAAAAGPRALVRRLAAPLADPGIRLLCLVGLVLMAAFVSLYNYLAFRLLAPPFGLSQTLVGLVFLAYLAGTSSSPVAGALGDRVGRRTVLWASVLLGLAAVGLTLPDVLPLVLGGLVLFTVGFFGAHSVASAWVGRRAHAYRAQASALYVLSYYLGSSVGGTLGGVAFGAGGWPGLAGWVAGLFLAALGLALALRRLPPVAQPG